MTITYPNSATATIESGESMALDSPFQIEIASDAVTGVVVPITLTLQDADARVWQETFEIGIYESSSVSGLITDADSGQAIGGAEISFTGDLTTGSTVSNPDGSYTFSVINGSYQVRASAVGYLQSESVTIEVPPSVSGLDFALGIPELSINPSSFSSTLNAGQSEQQTLTISNSGNHQLDYSILVGYSEESYGLSANSFFYEGFESGELDDGWVVNSSWVSHEVQQGAAAGGDYSLYLKSGNFNWHRSGVYHNLDTDSQPRSIQFSVKPKQSDQNSGAFTVYDRSAYSDLIRFSASDDGFFSVNSTNGGNQSYPYEPDRWYNIEFRNIDWENHHFDFYVDGFVVQSAIPFLYNGSRLTGASRVYLYNFDAEAEANWDNIVFSEGLNWLRTSFSSGTLAPGETDSVGVHFDASGLVAAEHTGELVVHSNDPNQPTVAIPVDLTVATLPNSQPTAISQNVTIDEDTFVDIQLQGTDPDGNVLRSQITALPSSGTLYQVYSNGAVGQAIESTPAFIVHQDNLVRFAPGANESGVGYGSFEFVTNDGLLDSDSATITINVTTVNDPPIARDDTTSTPDGSAIDSIPVLINDNDADGETPSISSFTQGARGVVSNNGDGSLSYAPEVGFVDGTDTFTYTISDGEGATATATVLVRVGYLFGGDWTTFGAGPQHTGYYNAFLAGESFTKVWEREFDQAPNQVAIAQGRVYMTQNIRFNPAFAWCFDLSSGAEVWKHSFAGSNPNSVNPPTWYEGRLYIQRGNHSSDSQLWCLDANTGTAVWNSPFSAQWEKYYAPAVTKDGIWVNGGSYGGLYGFNPDGSQKFFTNLAQVSVWTPSVGLDGTVYSWVGGDFTAHDPDTGNPLWSLEELASSYHGANSISAITDTNAYFVSGSELYSIDLASQAVDWNVAGQFTWSPAVANGIVYVIANNSNVEAYDKDSGQLISTFTTGSSSSLEYQPIVTDDALIVASRANTYIFDLLTQQLIQTLPDGGYLSLSDGALVIADPDRFLRMYRILTSGNAAPEATDQNLTLNEESEITITLSGTDSDGEIVYPIITRLPLNGVLYQTTDGTTRGARITAVPSLLDDPAGRVLYVPEIDGFGDEFDDLGFVVSDGRVLSPDGVIRFDVIGTNDPPVAIDDVVATRAGQTVTSLRVLTNDYDVDYDALSIHSVGSAGRGTASENADGTLQYIPDADFLQGEDQFTYEITDPEGEVASATVTVVIGTDRGTDWTTFGNGPAHTGFTAVTLGSEIYTEKWSRQLDNRSHRLHQVAIEDGRMFATSDIYHSDAYLWALDTITGAEVWRKYIGKPSSMNPPTAYGGRVYFQNGKVSSSGILPSQLWSVDALNGVDIWKAPIAAQWESYFAPAVNGEGVWVQGGSYGGMYGFDLDGNENFFVNLSQYDEWVPSIGADGTVYSWVAGEFTAHDPVSGESLWSVKQDWDWHGWSMDSVSAIGANRAYVIGSPGLHCINLQTQIFAWSDEGDFKGSPALANGIVYAITNDGDVNAYNSRTGELLQTYLTNDSNVYHQPVVTSDSLIVASNTDTYVFDLYSGNLRQTIPFGGKVSIASNRIFIAGSNHTIKAYGISDDDNQTPEALSTEVTIAEDSRLVLNLEGLDADGDPITAYISQLPNNGSLYYTNDGSTLGERIEVAPALVSNNQVIYVPAQDGEGQNYGDFEFAVADGIESSPPVSVTIHVSPLNDSPRTRDDYFTTLPGHIVPDLRVLTNDADVDGDNLTVVSFTQPSQGDIIQTNSGGLQYNPSDSPVEGLVSFEYTAADPSGATSSAIVWITISSSIGSEWSMYGAKPLHNSYVPVNLGSEPWLEGWSFDTESGELNQVAVGNGQVYVSPTSYFNEAKLIALNEVNGAESWRKLIGDVFSMNPPSFSDGKVYVQHGKSTGSTIPAQLLCLDSTSGAEIWSQNIAAQWEKYYAPTVADGSVWVNGGSYGGMYGFNAADGTELFFKNLAQEDEWTPAYDGSLLYSCLEGLFQAHDPVTGADAWELNLEQPGENWIYENRVIIDSGKAFIIEESYPWQGMVCINLATQTESWRLEGSFRGEVAAANGFVYVMKTDGDVLALNAETGILLQVYSTGDSQLHFQPIVTNDTLIVSSASSYNSHQTYIFERYTGVLLHTLPVGGKLSLANGRLLIAGYDGVLRTYGRPAPDNDPPTATPGELTMLEDGLQTIRLQGSDEDGDPLRAVITALPNAGALYQTADGITKGAKIEQVPSIVQSSNHQVLYEPGANQNGAGYGNFTFLMSDAYTYSQSADFTINVTPTNDIPVAHDDFAATRPRQLKVINVLYNDIDADGDNLIVTSFSQGTHGSVAPSTNRSLAYTPNNDITDGTDTFTYQIRDALGETSTATVKVTISENAEQDWTTFGGNTDRTGYVNANLGSSTWNPGWTYNEPNNRPIQAVAVASGKVFMVPQIYHNETYAIALDAADGSQSWRHDFVQAARINPPSFHDGKVYIQRGNHSSDSQLWCLAEADGSSVWNAAFSDQWSTFFAPAVTDDGIWINGGTYGGIYGFNPDGSQKFFHSLPQYDEWAPSIDSSGNVYSWVAGDFVSHDPETGEELWSVNLGWDWHGWSMDTVAAIGEGKAFVVGSPGLHAIDLSQQESIWSIEGSFAGSPAIANGVVYALKGDTIEAYNAQTGNLLTIYSTGSHYDLVNQPIITNDLLIASNNHSTYIFQLYTGQLLQTLLGGGPLSLANEVIYAAGYDGVLRTYKQDSSLDFSPDGGEFVEPVSVTFTSRWVST